ncbi:M67 family metallopeptidase [Sphingomonas sp.]|uniref:M67 family metallopeptidase n=1 Tax=Sphingomonas sp. TaxID=28214 RepID=UPI001DD80F3C|nr:M67 family metallopeptidase [Sphingomonas sp.]MBX9796354.1 M67 family metallopeptidase [Sphingomonas sp.]
MVLEISSRALDAIMHEASRDPAREVCGLLLGRGSSVTVVVPCRNVAADPARRFEIDPAALIAAHRAARDGGPAVIGHYHSHPGGAAAPSSADTAMAAQDGAIWLILGAGEIAAWRAQLVPGQAAVMVPIAIATRADSCTSVMASPEGRNPFCDEDRLSLP